MGQDPAGRAYLWAFALFALAAAVTLAAFLFRRRLPFATPVLIVGGIVVGLGVAFLVYLLVLMARGTSQAEYDEFIRNSRKHGPE